ncbi:MAG: hypothetical protein JOZ38_11485 [Candidatus Eremiobacteraeota bacterium]|nr:hypothetical protein [Candidatus Eremiobacteraeota bacterium]
MPSLVGEKIYSLRQTEQAIRALRDRIGLPPARYTTEEMLAMLRDEIAQLRARGDSDEHIAKIIGLATSTHIEAACVSAIV